MTTSPEFSVYDFATTELGLAVPRSAQPDRFEKEYAGTFSMAPADTPEPTLEGIAAAAERMRSTTPAPWEVNPYPREPQTFRLYPGAPPPPTPNSVESFGKPWLPMPSGSTLGWWPLGEQRHPTRQHFYLCRVHSDCLAHEPLGHACWLAEGRVSGDARPLGERAWRWLCGPTRSMPNLNTKSGGISRRLVATLHLRSGRRTDEERGL